MPFGLRNSLGTFNQMMDKIFWSYCSFTSVLFEDILIFSKILEEKKKHLKIICVKLKKHNLYINKKKSEFFLQEINYLVHVISFEDICMDPSKLRVIGEWPQPRNLYELKSFIGMRP